MRTCFLAITLLLILAAASTPCAAQQSIADDDHWDPRFAPPALFSNPHRLEVSDEYIFVTGQKYDGAAVGTMYSTGPGSEPTELLVPGWEDAVIVAGDHEIYARREDGAIALLDLALQRADSLSPPPGPSPGFLTHGDTLLALTNGQVHRWTVSGWKAMGPPLGRELRYVTVGVTGVYGVEGPGSICDPADCRSRVWRLSDSVWTQIGITGDTWPKNPPVSAIKVTEAGELVIAGDFTEIDGVPAARAARWDGRAWSPLGDGPGEAMGFIGASASIGESIFLAGTSGLIRRWDGSRWSDLATSDGFVRELDVQGGRLYARGRFTVVADTAAYGVAVWDPETERWSPVFPVLGSGVDGMVSEAVIGPRGDLFVGGRFDATGAAVAKNVARWDGGRWWSVGDGMADPVLALAADGRRVYAASHRGVAVADMDAPRPSFRLLHQGGWVLGFVQDLLVIADTVYAAIHGKVEQPGGVHFWDGGAWQRLGEALRDGQQASVYALARDASGGLLAAGDFTSIEGVAAGGVARWDGSAWHSLGDGPGVVGMAVVAGNDGVYLATVDGIHRWDRANGSWSVIGLPESFGGCEPIPVSMLHRPDGIYVGMTQSCVVTVGKRASGWPYALSRWDGAAWSVPGSGISEWSVEAIAASGDDLYVVGSFFEAGAVPSQNVARWNARVRLQSEHPEKETVARIAGIFPNPFTERAVVQLQVDRLVHRARLDVFDVLGRRVATLLDGAITPGLHELTFYARGAAPGLYLVRFRIGDRLLTGKLILAE